jgi:uncharacterized protein YkwD
MSTARFRYTLVAGATAVVIGSGFTFAGLRSHAGDDAAAATPRAAAAPLDAPVPPGQADLSLVPGGDGSTPVTSAPTVAPTSASPKPKVATVPRPKPKPKPKPRPTTAPPTNGSIIDQVLAHINAARTDAGLKALKLNADLSRASALHNQRMISGCGLSHQCTGEKGLDRFNDVGVSFRSAGENIGFSSSGSSNSAQVRAANGLTDGMLAEKPPKDGHRKNLLSTGFTKIGLSVVRDGGRMWFTQDFVG